ncbi:hypothetical protein ACFFR3_35190 [Nonomuraea salmonea]|uniref:HTH cro/C1-type domain-containing protein n=1 Tax=Nonomuraea salmonea TaxID=46181 RepID=A0ABV5NWR3_9ACTN
MNAIDPTLIGTRQELTSQLNALFDRGGWSVQRLAEQAGLSTATVHGILRRGVLPQPGTLTELVKACDQDPTPWLEARGRAARTDRTAAGQPAAGPGGLIRLTQIDPRRLGVHAPIDAPGAVGDLPSYVDRDADEGPRGVRAVIGRAAQRGGLVVLVGGSCVGKTRCAYEGLLAVVPDRWLLHPADTAQIRRAAETGPEHLVVWLDELHCYLDDSDPLTAATVRTLLDRAAIVIGTMWPPDYHTYLRLPGSPQPAAGTGARDVMRLAEVVHLDGALSTAEQERARAVAAAGDRRIALALRASCDNLFQVIAAAPQLLARARGADAYAAAILHAAVDATRLGVRSPLSPHLLRQAAPGYCDARQRAQAPDNWFEAALAYLTEKLDGAAAVLAPAAPPRVMGRPAGYVLAEYLRQHLGEQRRRIVIPASTWGALAEHVTNADDKMRTCAAASDRLLHDYVLRALPTEHPGVVVDTFVAARLASLLEAHDRADDAAAFLRPYAAAEDAVAVLLAQLLARHGREADLYALADANHAVARWLAEWLTGQGRDHDLRARIDAGDAAAAAWLARLDIDRLAHLGRENEALALLRPRADAGDSAARRHLISVMVQADRAEEAIAFLRDRADAGDTGAATELDYLLADHGHEAELRARADAGSRSAGLALARRLTAQGQEDDALAVLRPLADADGYGPAMVLAELLAKCGYETELRLRGDPPAFMYLAKLLREQGRADELRAGADAGDSHCARELVGLLADQGQVKELRARVDWGDPPAAPLLIEGLKRAGLVEEADRVRRYGLPLPDDRDA